ncbi:uncharacterized protein MONOS_4669 [Monocercomonoides exilis]|uniref:uncharacterized protein n=1 Tax=Monocercomonoides exilis TaxID=2049356 RepID=UPI0035593A5F|nr:hypothetical protein MONOS_4669 [Monocercomonoides exilis]|eukprot:MONOS_4669.1-p1 / transcript=MONOS_4669.1 / gene=MONOS_4669 / organism=Monocercomonoides_exilis_PA203 / gene_product=unspecified product / transcript_product=unspecified product / location=Mono_scaffold00126:86725-88071(+) / protein_length=376 / sequence_SO=supercontig / SO=protein_coding / is_pseudo=false
MNALIGEMEWKELDSILTKETFDKIDKLMGNRKLSTKAAVLLLKNIGFCNVMKDLWTSSFCRSLLFQRIEEMIYNEGTKMKRKNEKLLADLCESYLLLHFVDNCVQKDLLSICIRCLLNVGAREVKGKEAQNEAEIALLALSNIFCHVKIREVLYWKEISRIIQFHQEHHNLTLLAYQSAWLIFIFGTEDEELFINAARNLDFVNEATKELEELERVVERKKAEEKTRGMNEICIFKRWLITANHYFSLDPHYEANNVQFIARVVRMCSSIAKNQRDAHLLCMNVLMQMTEKGDVSVADLVKGGVVDFCLKELKEKKRDEMEEAKRKELKRKVFEKMEEEGYEDVIISFRGFIDFFSKEYYFGLSLDASNYFVNV